jgi:hypothetical protein
MADTDEISARALGLMEALAGAYADGKVPQGPDRGIVGRRTAMDAVMQVFAVVHEQLEAEEIPEDIGLHVISMLMLLREYVLSLPDPPDDGEVLSDDLASLVRMLDEAWES